MAYIVGGREGRLARKGFVQGSLEHSCIVVLHRLAGVVVRNVEVDQLVDSRSVGAAGLPCVVASWLADRTVLACHAVGYHRGHS